jgi:hypothetical protein
MNKTQMANLIVELWREYSSDKEILYRKVEQGAPLLHFTNFIEWLIKKYV